MIINVELNGTDENPYAIFGLTQNPFPQIADQRYAGYLLRLASLGGEPIPDTNYIRERLKDWSDEFIELCCKQFVKGKLVKFRVRVNNATI